MEINLDQVALLGPLMAGHILSAYYSVLLLKKQTGIDITPEMEMKTLAEVLKKWSEIQSLIEKAPKKSVRIATSESQEQED